jgi:hypothetical protein
MSKAHGASILIVRREPKWHFYTPAGSMGLTRHDEVMKIASPGTFDVVLGHDGTSCIEGTHWDVWLPRGSYHLPENKKNMLGPHLEAADWHFLTGHFSERFDGITAEQRAGGVDVSGPEAKIESNFLTDLIMDDDRGNDHGGDDFGGNDYGGEGHFDWDGDSEGGASVEDNKTEDDQHLNTHEEDSETDDDYKRVDDDAIREPKSAIPESVSEDVDDVHAVATKKMPTQKNATCDEHKRKAENARKRVSLL